MLGHLPGVDGDARYDEGVLVGYRWYDQHGQQPRFPFGHGLSYGEYEYGRPRLEQDETTDAVTVSVQVTNVGGRTGTEVIQLYVAARPRPSSPPGSYAGSPSCASIPAPPARFLAARPGRAGGFRRGLR
jgi:beta-glucosidase